MTRKAKGGVCLILVLCLMGSLGIATSAVAENVPRENTLVWTVPALPQGLDIYYGSTLQGMECIRNIYDSVVGYPPVKDASGFLVPDFTNPVGALADSWTLSDDGSSLTVKLKEGVLSPYGNELCADDFIYERERCTKLMGVNNWQNEGMGITDPATQVTKIDKYTFKIDIGHPNPIIVPFMSHMANHIIDSAEYKKHEGQADDPDGTRWSNTQGAGYGFLLGGAVLIETVFSWGGLGQYVTAALANKDYAAIQGFMIIATVFSMFVYLLVDIAYMVIDPRVKF